jgi:hypothetical protein
METMGLILANNPGKTIDQILVRPDVQQVLSYPFQVQALPTISSAVKTAWENGVQVGFEHGNADLAVLGQAAATPSDVDETVLQAILANVEDNATAAHDRLITAMTTAQPGEVQADMTKVLNDLRNRAQLAVDAARSRAATEGRLATYQGKPVQLMWVTAFKPTTCAMCASLHGTVIGLGDTFPVSSSFTDVASAPYVDLNGPPRHPNCGCHVVAYSPDAHVPGGTSPETMKTWAKKWWKKEGKA